MIIVQQNYYWEYGFTTKKEKLTESIAYQFFFFLQKYFLETNMKAENFLDIQSNLEQKEYFWFNVAS